MRLVAQLLSGLQVELEVSAEELVCQVARRAARLLQTGRLKFITQASVELPSWRTVGEAGLLEGELLTALVQRDIAGCVGIDLGDVPTAEAVRQAVEAVDGPYAVKVSCETLGAAEVQVKKVPWAALSGAEELVLNGLVLTQQNVDGLIRGLNQLTKLWKLDLTVVPTWAESFLELLQALPEGLEELRVNFEGQMPRAKNIVPGVRPLKCLRTVNIFHSPVASCEQLVEVFPALLPNSLEEISVHMEEIPFPSFWRHFPCMTGLRKVSFSTSTCVDELLSCVKTLPAGLAELDLGGCCLRSEATGQETPLFTMTGELSQSLQRLTQLRRAVCPQGGGPKRQSYLEATAVLLALPPGLEDLGLPQEVAGYEGELEALEMGLRSFPGMTRVAFPHCVQKGDWDRTVWERIFAALPKCLEHLEFGMSFGDRAALDEAAAGQFKHLPNLKSVCFRNLQWSAASLAALPQTVESILFKGSIREQGVRALRARLTEPQLAQILRTNISVEVPVGPQVTSEMFKAWLANG